MSTNNDFTKIRKAFLDAVNDPQVDTGSLRAMMGELRSYPGIFVTYAANGACQKFCVRGQNFVVN